jgi:hypothetical protein
LPCAEREGTAAFPTLNMLLPGWSLDLEPAGLAVQPQSFNWQDGRGLRIASPSGGQAVVEFESVARFLVDTAERQIRVQPLDPRLSTGTLDHLLYDQLVPRLLDHGGELAVHAAAVATSRGALLFVGDSGRGKSTLAAALGRNGCTLLGDDGVRLETADGVTMVSAIYPSLRLLPDSLAALFEDRRSTSATAFYSAKRRVEGEAASFPPLPVRALFVLGEPPGPERVRIAPLAPGAACMELVRESFALDPADKVRAAARLSQAAAAAETFPGFSLDYRRDYARLGEVIPAVLEAAEERKDHGPT